ncbi:diheme cytochrome SoxA (sulfur oxidation) [Insolitispirillum peregrinum]|uniref:SoxAX cytochrome complex subunit A n=2 Tax=Insolitispirillum peregrinum TaxID=80876 RepID=A0A1N7ML59_9PROT|nr:diheme cytochrome SoxA (sulfur oxidation) [Insolitispirillum peregrinum]
MMTAAFTVPKWRLRWFLDLLALTLWSSTVQAAEVALPSLPTDLAAYRIGQSYSGLLIADPTTREMEWDDVANPGMLWVERAQALWEQRDGQAGKACGDCHHAPASLRGAATGYPQVAADGKTLHTLEDRINQCRQQQMQAAPWPYDSDALVAMTTLVKGQSRGLPMAVRIDGPAARWFRRGEQVYQRRIGLMRLSCHDCHVTLEGASLRAEQLSQGQSNGFPTYRLKWQDLGSLQRRFRECNSNIKAEPLPYGDPDYQALELYLAWRGNGLPIETPAVRK